MDNNVPIDAAPVNNSPMFVPESVYSVLSEPKLESYKKLLELEQDGDFILRLAPNKDNRLVELAAPFISMTAYIDIICGDLFVICGTDMETVPLTELDSLYESYVADKVPLWLCKRRKQLPRKEIVSGMKAKGEWTDEWVELENSLKEVFGG